MARKFRIPRNRIRISNRCIICGRVIPWGSYICSNCSRRGRQITVNKKVYI